jgi:DNA-directed RNA polymerase specialized sigma24 family protein
MMTLTEFLGQYRETITELEECKTRLLELEDPRRGNRIVQGEHSGISNQPEEYAVMKDKLERQIKYLDSKRHRTKKTIEALLRTLKPRQAKLLRRKYIEGLNTQELAAWMHITHKSAIAAVKLALEKAEPEYFKFIENSKKQ